MTLKEAAASLGVTPDNLRGAIARGTLKATKLGRDWIVTPKEVERYRHDNLRGKRPVCAHPLGGLAPDTRRHTPPAPGRDEAGRRGSAD